VKVFSCITGDHYHEWDPDDPNNTVTGLNRRTDGSEPLSSHVHEFHPHHFTTASALAENGWHHHQLRATEDSPWVPIPLEGIEEDP